MIDWTSDTSKQLWAKCECGNVFKVADLPMDMRQFGKALKKARCAECGADGKKLRLPSKADIDAKVDKPLPNPLEAA